MNKKRILHIVAGMEIGGGIETWLMNVLRNIDRTQFPMDFLCISGIKGRYASEIESYGSEVILLSYKNKKNPFDLLKFSIRVIKMLRKNKYSIVHIHVQHSSGFYLLLAYLAGIPIRIVHSHSSRERHISTLRRKLFRKLMNIMIRLFATSGIAVSDLSARDLFGETYKREKRWKIIYYGIDASAYLNLSEQVRINIRKEFGIPDDFFVIGHVGRFTWEKNHKFIVTIAKEAIERQPKIRFLLVGDGPLRAPIERLIKDMGLSNYFIFTGTRDDVPDLLRAIDIFLFPSFFEGLPVAVIEAQLSILRCLVSDCVPNEIEFIPDALTFMSINKGPAVWAGEALKLLHKPRLSSPDMIKHFKRSQFTVDACIQRLVEIYNN